jgi:hypothetical protein
LVQKRQPIHRMGFPAAAPIARTRNGMPKRKRQLRRTP